jgi:hypothetical protein
MDTDGDIGLSNNIAGKNITVNNKLSVANEAIALTSTLGGVKLTATNGGHSKLEMDTDGDIGLSNNIAGKNITVNNKLSVANEAIALTSTLGGVKLTAKDNTFAMETAGDVRLTSNTTTTDNIVVTNTKGNAANAINLEASAGGVLVSADGDLANAIKLHATAGSLQTINLLNTAGTNNAAQMHKMLLVSHKL